MTKTNGDFGASHNFGMYSKEIVKISRTVYFKATHLNYIMKYAEDNKMNLSQATDIIIQSGIAWQEKLKVDNQERLTKYVD